MLAENIVFGYLLRYITAINANADMCVDGIEHTDEEIFGPWLVYNLKKIRMYSHPARQRPTTATNHIQQNQNNTPNAVTGPLFS